MIDALAASRVCSSVSFALRKLLIRTRGIVQADNNNERAGSSLWKFSTASCNVKKRWKERKMGMLCLSSLVDFYGHTVHTESIFKEKHLACQSDLMIF